MGAQSRGQALRYLPELDGMRAVGLMTVIYAHTLVRWDGPRYTGGFYAMDTFFVLSGYLITTLLIREWDRFGTISLKNFYVRRALRLLPALFVAVLLGLVVDRALGGAFPRPYYQSAFAALSYVANWFQIQLTIAPMEHTWSLSVEEQYYLVWSAAVVIGFRSGASKLRLAAVAGLGALAMGVMRFAAFHIMGAHFVVFSTLTRPDGVLIGSALALVLADIPPWLLKFLERKEVGLVLLGVVAYGTSVLKWWEVPYAAGGLTVFNLLTATLIGHMLVAKSSLPRRIFSLRPLVGLGRISYGIYLYHVPLLYLITGRPAAREGGGYVFLVFAASIASGIASWFLVERPVLVLKSRFGSMSASPDVPATPPKAENGKPDRPEEEKPDRPEEEKPDRPEEEKPDRPEEEKPDRPEEEKPTVR